MHLPDGLLDIWMVIVLWVVSILVLIGGYKIRSKKYTDEESEKMIPFIGVFAAVIFAFQFVNYPVPGGTSGHLVGGTLIAVIIGPWEAVLVLFMILVVQSFFGDGGITAIGANTFNMGIIGGIGGFIIVKLLVMGLKKTKIPKETQLITATAIGAYISIVLAAFICGIQIGVSDNGVPVEFAVGAMVFWHLLIGIGEAIISALIVAFIYKVKPELIQDENFFGGEMPA